MSSVMEEEIKRSTARRKSALVLDILQGKTAVSGANRQFDLPPSEIESWVDGGKRGMENALRAKPEDVREQYARQLKNLQEAHGEAMLELRSRKNWRSCRARTRSDGHDLAGTAGRRVGRLDGEAVPLVRSGTAERVLPANEGAAVGSQPALAEPIKELIEEEPWFGYRMVAGLLRMNKNTVQRVFPLKG